MKIVKATFSDAEKIYNTVKETVEKVYTECYNKEAADFFMHIHSLENIENDIKKFSVYMVCADGKIIGTGTCKKDYITRVYILPEFEHKGIGTELMEKLENEIRTDYDCVYVDPSVVAVPFYEKRGYCITQHEEVRLSENTSFAHDVYKKELR